MTFPTLPTVWVPPLNCNTPATVLVKMSTRGVHVQKNRVSKRQYTIQTTERKEPRHASVLVWVYNDTNLIIWRWSYICRTRRESLGNEIGFFFGIYSLSQRRNREYDLEGFLCMRVCVCVYVRACGRPVGTTPSKPSWWPFTFWLLAKPRGGTWVPQDDRRIIWPVFWSWYYQLQETCALGQPKWQVQRELSCMQSRYPVTTSNGLSAAGTRGTRLWATVTRWWV